MCGIVGFASPGRFEELKASLPEAMASLAHRGPDADGMFLDPASGVGLGHRRLAVIDLSPSGRQPMTSPDGRVHLVCNGEIYNYREIRKTLTHHGYRFTGESDTEAALCAFHRWGVGCLPRLTGMFALAVWDAREKALYLARDRSGIKPLYYHRSKDTLLFGSEIKALTAFPRFDTTVDTESLSLFFHYQYVPSPGSIFKNTFKLLPGHYLKWTEKTCETHGYWRPPGPPPSSEPRKEGEIVEELNALLIQAVKDHLASDVPLGALLSGGIDSSLVTAVMQQVSPSPVKTFCIGFSESGYDESPYAGRVAEVLQTDHTSLTVSAAEARKVLFALPEMYDEPFADSSAIPTAVVSRLARSRVTVAVSGDGGDELFCGYVRYWAARTAAERLRRLPRTLRALGAETLRRLPTQWAARIYLPLRERLPRRFQVSNFKDKWSKLPGMLEAADLSEIYRAAVAVWSRQEVAALTGVPPPPGRFEAVFRGTAGWPVLARLMYVDQETYLPDAMLTKADRASMSVGLEMRVPLLDHRIVEFAAALPERYLYRKGAGKYLLRRLVGRYLPPDLFNRPKTGFGVPISRWLRKDLKPLVLDYLSEARLKREGLLDAMEIGRYVTAHMKGESDHPHRLWAVLMWEMWRERWISR